jgi:hypothetical protein
VPHDIWSRVEGEKNILPMMGTIHRVTDDQQLIATLALVNNIEEQDVLETLLENSKPHKPEQVQHLDYLLMTPFRYPPLPYGSRFGGRFEPSLFYGSLNLSTALAETAYYKFVFLSGMKEKYDGPLQITYSSYTVSIKTERGIFLNQIPFTQYETEITSPTQYQNTQALGCAMRQAKVEAFQYLSARDLAQGKNIALFTAKAFHAKKPLTFTHWICHVAHEEIGFISHDNQNRYSFNREQFLINNTLPAPAC